MTRAGTLCRVTAALDHHYVFRPRPALAQVAAPHAWFAVPASFSFSSVSVTLTPLDEAELKLRFLARIHDDAVEAPTNEWQAARRDDARAFVSAVPLDLATFDRFWTIEPVGLPTELAIRHLSTESLRAVLPVQDVRLEGATAMQSLRKRWARHVEQRPMEEACALVALRFAVSRLFAAFPDDLVPPRVSVHGLAGVPPQGQLDAALAEDGWVQSPDATLWMGCSDIQGLFGVEGAPSVRVSSPFRVMPLAKRRRALAWGSVTSELRREGEAWRVTEATLETTARRPLL